MPENEIDEQLDVEINVPFPEFDEYIHILNDQDKDEDNYSKFSLDHLFSETLFENEEYQIQNYEIACMETQNNELTLKEDLAFTSDTYELEFEGNSKNQIMVLNPYEDEGVIYESNEPINGNHVTSVEFDENS